MPRGDKMPPNLALIHALILAEEKAGKTSWLLAAAESGFNVLLLDGDVAQQRINDLSPAAKRRVFYMDVSDDLVGETDPRMIQTVADFFVATRFLWNDRTQREYSRTKDPHDEETGACLDEIWEIRPAYLDHNWVLGVDSWTTLSYSAMLAKAQDLGESISDVEKIERSLYSGVGNRLTNILFTQQKTNCHTVVLGHPTQYEKKKNPEGNTVRNTKEVDQIIEWTRMVAKSSSNPHGYSMGKFFSDIGWIDVDKFGKRVLDFIKTNTRTSGGNLNSKGDPRVDHRFEDLVRKIGGHVPGAESDTPLGEGFKIFEAGTYIPPAKPVLGAKKPAAAAAGSTTSESPAPTQVKGLGGLAGLKNLGKK